MKNLTQLPKILTKQRFKKPIYAYWTFWLIVLILSILTFYIHIRIITWGNMAGIRIKTEKIQEMQQAYKKNQEKVLEELKSDTYGGKTPEETLRLFVEALEERDVDLASKYISNDRRDEFKKDFYEILDKNDKEVDRFVQLYNQGTVKHIKYDGYHKVQLFDNNGNILFNSFVEYNNFTKVWKLKNW